MGVVYLLGDSLKEGFYKIGVTRGAIEKRIKKLQTGNAGEIYLVNSFETNHPFILEKMLHNRYFGKQAMGEWYELCDDDVINFAKICESLQTNIDILIENNFYFQKKFGGTN